MSDCCLTPNDQYEELDNSKNSGKPYKNTNFDKEDTGKRTGNVSSPFPQRPDRQRTAILLLFVSNPTHRHLRTVLPVLLQTETSRNGSAGHSERLFHR